MLAVLCLPACTPPVQAIADAYNFNRSNKQKVVAQTKLDSRYEYLLITIHGRSLFMARGHVDPGLQGPVEVWFSGGGEVLRTLNGRVVGAVGMPVEWSAVTYSPLPEWSSVKAPTDINRRRDVMPDYRYGIIDNLELKPIETPSSSDFLGEMPAGTQWFSETSAGDSPLPRARYAVVVRPGEPSIAIYGEQCLSRQFCFSWQRWPNKTQG